MRIPSPSVSVAPATASWSQRLHRAALRFIFHILLISLFETLFFWYFISRNEDEALIHLVNTYTSGLVTTCRGWNATERAGFLNVLTALLPVNETLAIAAAAAASRHAFNNVLFRNSWLYIVGGTGLFGCLSVLALYRRLPVPWRHVVCENLALVTLLGCYEWMFFSTVALRYRAVSIEELDGMITSEIIEAC